MAGIKPRRISGMLAAFSGRPVPGARAAGVARGGHADRQVEIDDGDELDLQAIGQDGEYYGHFSVQNKMYLRGWAAARSKASESLRVSILVDEAEIGVLLADRPRANLKDLFGEDIRHGFA